MNHEYDKILSSFSYSEKLRLKKWLEKKMNETKKRLTQSEHELIHSKVKAGAETLPKSIPDLLEFLNKWGTSRELLFSGNFERNNILYAYENWRRSLHIPESNSDELDPRFVVSLMGYQLMRVIRGGLLHSQEKVAEQQARSSEKTQLDPLKKEFESLSGGQYEAQFGTFENALTSIDNMLQRALCYRQSVKESVDRAVDCLTEERPSTTDGQIQALTKLDNSPFASLGMTDEFDKKKFVELVLALIDKQFVQTSEVSEEARLIITEATSLLSSAEKPLPTLEELVDISLAVSIGDVAKDNTIRRPERNIAEVQGGAQYHLLRVSRILEAFLTLRKKVQDIRLQMNQIQSDQLERVESLRKNTDELLGELAELVLHIGEYVTDPQDQDLNIIMAKFSGLMKKIETLDPTHTLFWPAHRYSNIVNEAMYLNLPMLIGHMREEHPFEQGIMALIQQEVEKCQAQRVLVVGVASAGAIMAGVVVQELKKIMGDQDIPVDFMIGLPIVSKKQEDMCGQLPASTIEGKGTTLIVVLDDLVSGASGLSRSMGSSIHSAAYAVGQKFSAVGKEARYADLNENNGSAILFATA
jgi:hypothetical protein